MQPPIADPNAAPQDDFKGKDVREFRVRFWHYLLANWLAILLISPVAMGGINLLLPAKSTGALVVPIGNQKRLRFPFPKKIQSLPAKHALNLLVFMSALTLAMIGYVWRFMPVRVERWGVRAVNFWTMPQQASWEQMSSVKYFWLFFPYAIVSCEGQASLWIWLSLKNPREFARAIAEWAPPDHLLPQFLRQRGLLP